MENTIAEKEKKMTLRMAGVEPESIVDGPGFRYVIFVQGCPHRCPGCHNPQSHDFDGGYTLGVDELWDDITTGKHLSGITFSGGEPFCQVEPLVEIAHRAKDAGLGIMSYSGYTYEELTDRRDAATDELLGMLDILVDGRFIEEERDLSLQFRGSSNQRVIDMNKTRTTGETVLWSDDYGI